MKRVVLAMILTVGFLGCGDSQQIFEPETNQPPKADVILNEGENITVPIAATLPHPCTGEMVSLEGLMHIVTHVTFTETGFHTTMVLNMKNVVGRGLVSGRIYRNNQEQLIEMSGHQSFETTEVTQWNFIRQGEDVIRLDDWVLHITMHFTLNAQGVPTAEVSNIKGECR